MFSPFVRLMIALTGIISIWMSFALGVKWNALIGIVGVVLIILGYFKNGTVYLAMLKLKKEDLKGAEKALAKTRHPEILIKSQRSYYHFVKGFIEMNHDRNDEAFNELSMALDLGLRTENDSSIVCINLAAIELERSRFAEALEFLTKSKNFSHKPQLDPEIERIEKEINVALELHWR